LLPRTDILDHALMMLSIELLSSPDRLREQLRQDGWELEDFPDGSLRARHVEVPNQVAARRRLRELGLLTSASLRVEFPPWHNGANPSETALVLCPDRLAMQVGGQSTLLTATQFRILAVLVGEPGRVFSRKELVERGIGTVVEERTVDVHIKELRRKLGPCAARLETVRHQGYRYVISTGEAGCSRGYNRCGMASRRGHLCVARGSRSAR
jgi:DNA-binding response OmpR family regulator